MAPSDAVKVMESWKTAWLGKATCAQPHTDSWSLQEFCVLQESELLFKTRMHPTDIKTLKPKQTTFLCEKKLIF